MKTYTSKNTIEAFQITEEMFKDATKANEAQKLPLDAIHHVINERFCTLNCTNKTLVYQGVTLNIGDYLIKSGNSLEPCSKDKFEDEFCYNEPCCGECNNTKEETSEEEFLKNQLNKFLEFAKEKSFIQVDHSNMTLVEIVDFALATLQGYIETKDEALNSSLLARPLETQEDFAEEILALMKKINLKSVTRDISGEVPENTFDYFKSENEISN